MTTKSSKICGTSLPEVLLFLRLGGIRLTPCTYIIIVYCRDGVTHPLLLCVPVVLIQLCFQLVTVCSLLSLSKLTVGRSVIQQPVEQQLFHHLVEAE